MFGDKSPANPYGIGARRGEGTLQASIIHVAALTLLRGGIEHPRWPEAEGFVGLAHKHGVTLAIIEKSNGPQRCAMLLIEVAGRVNETHGSLAAVHNCNALKFIVHKGPRRNPVAGQAAAMSSVMAVCSGSNFLASMESASAMV